jgi:hypothetical protein
MNQTAVYLDENRAKLWLQIEEILSDPATKSLTIHLDDDRNVRNLDQRRLVNLN